MCKQKEAEINGWDRWIYDFDLQSSRVLDDPF